MLGTLALMAVLQSASSQHGQQLPLEFWKSGDDGLTSRLFEALVGPDTGQADCSSGCYRVILGQAISVREGVYVSEVAIEFRPGIDADFRHVTTIEGSCGDEMDVAVCGSALRRYVEEQIRHDQEAQP